MTADEMLRAMARDGAVSIRPHRGRLTCTLALDESEVIGGPRLVSGSGATEDEAIREAYVQRRDELEKRAEYASKNLNRYPEP